MQVAAHRRGRHLPGSAPSNRRSRERIEAIVLQHLKGANAPIGAYEIAGRATTAGDRLVPNQVYRTLSRLMSEGRVCRVESLSAYMLNIGEGDAFLICDCCHAVSMIDVSELLAGLERRAREQAFRMDRALVELHGCCAECLKSGRK